MTGLRVDAITRDFPTRGEPQSVLCGVSLEMSAGENLAVVGPSGSGKSTLLHILGTLDRPTGGTVQLNGEDPFELDEPQLADFRNRKIGFVFQDGRLFRHLSVRENVAYGAARRDLPTSAASGVAHSLGLDDLIDRRPATLSGGETRRTA